ncbi:MAG: molybdenum cofactor biosynthesis protein MoaE [Acidimicrobiales bacterium]|nr:MAG: molybdenum cofactor biosynthesis protein MoaE [Acidimicrobiales bacterium]
MANVAVFAQLTLEALDADWQRNFVACAAAGAVVSFTGVVRDHDGGRSVASLRYEAHPGAARALDLVAEQLAGAHDVQAVAVAHRVGELIVGDVALLCTVSALHRAAAFAACEALVDTVKQRVPIWKNQRFTDGTAEWVGL